jgi:lipocalin-like protein
MGKSVDLSSPFSENISVFPKPKSPLYYVPSRPGQGGVGHRHQRWGGMRTAEENEATANGTQTYFGTYSVNDADRSIAIHVEGSSFPNWNGTDQSGRQKCPGALAFAFPGESADDFLALIDANGADLFSGSEA